MVKEPARGSFQGIVFDTDVLIWYFKNNEKAKKLISSHSYEERKLSSINLLELLQECRDQKEQRLVRSFIAANFSDIYHPSTAVSEKAIALIEGFSLSHGLRATDSLIAATALIQNARLATGNKKHFSFIPALELVPFVL